MENKKEVQVRFHSEPELRGEHLQPKRANETVDPNQVLDMESIDLLRSLNSAKDPDFFARLVDAFVTFGQKNITQMNEALHVGDLLSISRHAHALKGSCANFGAKVAVNLCSEIERKAASQDWQAVQTLAARLAGEFLAIKEILCSLRNPTTVDCRMH